jgi:hypothetical protein
VSSIFQGDWQFRIGHATSSDGLTWKKDSGNPVFTPAPLGQGYPDTKIVSHSHVIQDPLYGYHLFYAGGSGTFNLRLSHAWSPDGINWERDPNNPIIDLGTVTLPNGETIIVMTGGPSAIWQGDILSVYFMGTKTGTFSNAELYLLTADCSPSPKLKNKANE